MGTRRKTLKDSMGMSKNVAIYRLLKEKQNLKSSSSSYWLVFAAHDGTGGC